MGAIQTRQAVDDTNNGQIASAWILKVSDNLNVAISQYEMNHLEEQSDFIKIPKSPAWCNSVMLWKNQVVPVMDFTHWEVEHNTTGMSESGPVMVAIIRLVHTNSNVARYGAIRILQPPVLERVNNQQACQKTDITNKFSDVALSAFNYHDQTVVPVLDIEKLFSGAIEQ